MGRRLYVDVTSLGVKLVAVYPPLDHGGRNVDALHSEGLDHQFRDDPSAMVAAGRSLGEEIFGFKDRDLDIEADHAGHFEGEVREKRS